MPHLVKYIPFAASVALIAGGKGDKELEIYSPNGGCSINSDYNPFDRLKKLTSL